MNRNLLALLITFITISTFGQVVYVAHDATGANDGTSWEDAYTDIPSAMTGSGGEVWVKSGTYYPTTGTDRTIYINLIRDAYGGFNGTETMRSERDPEANETIISGNIGDPNLDTDNTRVLIQGTGSILDGFTLQEGYNEGGIGDPVAIYEFGGGDNEIINCVFRDSYSLSVAGVRHATSGILKVVGCEFYNLDGDGIMSAGSIVKTVELVNNVFYNNSGRPLLLDAGTYLVANNTVVNNSQGSSLSFVQNAEIFNNIFYNNATTELSTLIGTYDIRNNIIQGTIEPNNFDMDPDFVDIVESDFRLRSCSGARDLGNNSLLPASYTEDIEGNVRIFGPNVDPGAFEIEVEQLQLISSLPVDAACNGEKSGRVIIDASGGRRTGGNPSLLYSIDGGVTFFADATGNIGPFNAGTHDVFIRDTDGCEVQITGIVINEPEETKTPIVTDYNTTYGTDIENIVINPDPTDNEAAFFYFSDIGEGTLFKNDGVTLINEGDYITVAEGQAGLVFTPARVFPTGMVVEAAGADRSTCLSGNTAISLFNVAKAPLTAAMPDQTIFYGENPNLSVDYTGFVNGDDESDLNATITVTTSATSTSLPGTYPITVTGTTDSNYDITFVAGTITIVPAILSVSANDLTITYGDALPTLDGVISGVVNGDNITVSYTTNSSNGSDAGIFEITASLNDPDGKLSNYSVTNTSGTLTINAAELSVSANNKTISYGESLPSLDGNLSGVTNADNITASYLSSAMDGSDAGLYEITASLNDPDNRLSNYVVSNTSGTLTIEKVALTVTADDVFISEDEIIPDLTFNYSGFVNNEGATILDTTPTASTTGVAGIPGTYPITLSGGSDNNYNFSYVDGTLTIEDILSLEDGQRDVIVFPNPTSSQLNIQSKEASTIQVLDTSGRLLIDQKDQKEVDVSNLKRGIYLVRLSDRNGKVLFEGRVLKE